MYASKLILVSRKYKIKVINKSEHLSTDKKCSEISCILLA